MGTSLLELLLEDLGSDTRSVRCDALRQLATQSGLAAVRAQIEPLAGDPDPEVSFLARQVLDACTRQQRKGPATQFPTFASRLDLEERLFALPAAQFHQAIINCPTQARADLMAVLRERIANETDQQRLAAMLVAFRHWGEAGDEELLIPFLRSPAPMILIEVIGALERFAPKRLRESVVALLGSQHPSVQIRALRAMLKHDPRTGCAILERLFAAPNPAIRASATLQCLAIPFKLVKHYLFNLLSLENDPKVLERAAHVLYLNPAEETVYKLIEFADGAKPQKNQWCHAMLEKVLESIRLSGIMKDSVEQFSARIRRQVSERKTQTLLGACLDELAHADPLRRYEAVEALRDQAGIPEVRERLTALYQSETDPRVRGLLTGIFADNPDRDRLQQELTLAAFQRLPADLQLTRVSQVNSVEILAFTREQLHILAKAKIAPAVLAEVIRIFGRFGNAHDDLTPLTVALRNSDPMVQSRAIEGLAAIAPEPLIKELPRLIRDKNPLVRMAAIRAAMKLDAGGEALAVLESMLKSDSSALKEQALVCLAQMKFSTSRPLLLRFVGEEPNLALIKKAGTLFAANPDLDLIGTLHGFMRAATGPRKKALSELLDAGIAAASAAGLINEMPADYRARLDETGH